MAPRLITQTAYDPRTYCEEPGIRVSSPKRLAGLVAAAGCAVLLLAVPERAAACSGPGRTLEDVIAQSELIVEGDVTKSLANGLAFDLAVQEVFKGEVPGSVVRIGPAEDPGGRGCDVGLEVGAHVIVGVPDVDTRLSALSTAVWFIALDGSLSSQGGYYLMAANADDLRTKLRNAVPDSAMAGARRPAWSLLGAALLVVSGLFVVRRFAPRRTRATSSRAHEPRGVPPDS